MNFNFPKDLEAQSYWDQLDVRGTRIQGSEEERLGYPAKFHQFPVHRLLKRCAIPRNATLYQGRLVGRGKVTHLGLLIRTCSIIILAGTSSAPLALNEIHCHRNLSISLDIASYSSCVLKRSSRNLAFRSLNLRALVCSLSYVENRCISIWHLHKTRLLRLQFSPISNMEY
jgi:hypothetical protein